MISISGGESDIDLLGSNPDTNYREDMRTTKHFSILDEILTTPPTRNSTNTTSSTTSSTITHPLSYMIVTTAHSTINTTISTHTLRHNLPLPHFQPQQHHYHQTHPTMHHLHQSPHIHHPFPQQNLDPHPLTYNPSICHSPSTSFQVTPTASQNLNYLSISPNSAPTFNATLNHLSSKS